MLQIPYKDEGTFYQMSLETLKIIICFLKDNQKNIRNQVILF